MHIPKYKYTRAELEKIAASEWLTVRERRVFELFYRGGVRIEDIAAELGFDRRTVDRDLKSIRKKMLLKCR